MLILPVQRIPRYVLLLSDLRNNTDTSHPDYENLTKSYNAIKAVADSIDESIGKAKSRAQCIEIQGRLESLFGKKALPIPTLVEAHRVFIKEGVLKKQGPSRIIDQRFFFLFNDLLLITPIAADKFFTIKPIHLNTISLKNGSSTDPSFIILSYGESFTVYAQNLAEKKEWIGLLENCMRAFSKNVGQTKPNQSVETAPVWFPDESATHCMRCDSEFGVFVRKHHCRNCGAVVCKNCSLYTALVPGVDKHKEVRVCNVCKKIINQINK